MICPSILFVQDCIGLRDGRTTVFSLELFWDRLRRGMEYKSIEIQGWNRLGHLSQWLKLGISIPSSK